MRLFQTTASYPLSRLTQQKKPYGPNARRATFSNIPQKGTIIAVKDGMFTLVAEGVPEKLSAL